MYCEWSTVWVEQPIVVKVWYRNDWVFRLKEELWIGNMLVDRNRIGLINKSPNVSLCERLAAPVSIADCVHHLEVLISHVNYKTYYCNILLDGEVIGGDVDVNIPRTDLTKCSEIHRRGFLHFMVKYMYVDILKIVYAQIIYLTLLFPLTYICFYLTIPTPIVWESSVSGFIKITSFTIIMSLLGVPTISFNRWQIWEKLYADTLTHQRKLDLPPVRLESHHIP